MDIDQHEIVSRDEWQKARKALLAKEKEFTRLRDELSATRRQLPWERVETNYVFEGPDGPETLADLFGGKSQLVVYHFMFRPEAERGCPNCSFWADNFNGIVTHLEHRDVRFVAISRAPLAKLLAFRNQLGWSFEWVSSGGNTFNQDYAVSFSPEDVARGHFKYNYNDTHRAYGVDMPGISVFYKDATDATDAVFHTYSTYSRGIDMMNTAYHYLDLVPKGRDEETDGAMSWLRYRDRYER
ncbi:DUF899 domain-containing protein [Pendulispora brunnea]|uniref:DUF899 domain-containing protein n=1 Tax=Pendulispora brunnea TaxID=2905690 RepID=A0ABZ2JYG4_9BACT